MRGGGSSSSSSSSSSRRCEEPVERDEPREWPWQRSEVRLLLAGRHAKHAAVAAEIQHTKLALVHLQGNARSAIGRIWKG